jgi:glucokinase
VDWLLLLDVGGTTIKGAVCALSGNDRIFARADFDSRSDADAHTIILNFLRIFDTLIRSIEDGDKKIAGIAFAFPGDFDYEKGIPLLKNVQKYDSLYGRDLPATFRSLIGSSPLGEYFVPDYRFVFVHDIAAFLLGKINQLPRAYQKIMTVCVGTGAGSAFYAHGKLVDHEFPGVPFKGWIYNKPFRDGIIDDYISVRGLANLAAHRMGRPVSGEELSRMAAHNQKEALSIFTLFGEMLAECLTPFFQSFAPDCFILGGGIAKGGSFFLGPVQNICAAYAVQLVVEPRSTEYAMEGLLRFYREKTALPRGMNSL